MNIKKHPHEAKQDSVRNSNKKQSADSKSKAETADNKFDQHLNYFGTSSSIKL